MNYNEPTGVTVQPVAVHVTVLRVAPLPVDAVYVNVPLVISPALNVLVPYDHTVGNAGQTAVDALPAAEVPQTGEPTVGPAEAVPVKV